MVAARTLLKGDADRSIAAINRIVASDFRDPEGLFYLIRHFCRLGQEGPVLGLFEQVVAGGFLCYPAMARDSWLDPLRESPAFATLLRKAEAQHRLALADFARMDGLSYWVCRASYQGNRVPSPE